jgi:hypothetical protein
MSSSVIGNNASKRSSGAVHPVKTLSSTTDDQNPTTVNTVDGSEEEDNSKVKRQTSNRYWAFLLLLAVATLIESWQYMTLPHTKHLQGSSNKSHMDRDEDHHTRSDPFLQAEEKLKTNNNEEDESSSEEEEEEEGKKHSSSNINQKSKMDWKQFMPGMYIVHIFFHSLLS